MPRYEFEQDAAQATPAPQAAASRRAVGIVRGCGFALMAFGFVVSLAVMVEAWSLYRAPTSIERLAKAIEKGSNLDRSLTRASRHAAVPDETVLEEDDVAQPKGEPLFGFRFSYFVAWVVAILLLLLIGRLAIAAVKTGGELVLYERHVQKLAAEIVRESRRQPR